MIDHSDYDQAVVSTLMSLHFFKHKEFLTGPLSAFKEENVLWVRTHL
jgi:hypothetical protein